MIGARRCRLTLVASCVRCLVGEVALDNDDDDDDDGDDGDDDDDNDVDDDVDDDGGDEGDDDVDVGQCLAPRICLRWSQ